MPDAKPDRHAHGRRAQCPIAVCSDHGPVVNAILCLECRGVDLWWRYSMGGDCDGCESARRAGHAVARAWLDKNVRLDATRLMMLAAETKRHAIATAQISGKVPNSDVLAMCDAAMTLCRHFLPVDSNAGSDVLPDPKMLAAIYARHNGE